MCYNIKAFWDSRYAGVVKLADTLDLGSSSSECRFNSCHPHHLKTLYRGSCGVAVYHACLSRRRSRVRFPSGPPLCAHVVQLDRILDYGSRGCGFESCHARHLILRFIYFNNRDLAQLGRASGLGPEGHRFESCSPDH